VLRAKLAAAELRDVDRAADALEWMCKETPIQCGCRLWSRMLARIARAEVTVCCVTGHKALLHRALVVMEIRCVCVHRL
jgi:hypothetical protein